MITQRPSHHDSGGNGFLFHHGENIYPHLPNHFLVYESHLVKHRSLMCHFLFCIFLMQSGQFSEDMIPTVGFNMRKVTKGNVTIKVNGLL